MNASAKNMENETYEFLYGVMTEYVAEIVAKGILNYAFRRTKVGNIDIARDGLPNPLVERLLKGVELFMDDCPEKEDCKKRLSGFIGKNVCSEQSEKVDADLNAIIINIISEDDIVIARNQARFIANAQGFSKTEQIKIATAVSELTRNVIKYAGKGKVVIQPINGTNRGIRITCEDSGKGIDNMDEIMSGEYKSKTGLGLGIIGCQRIMDEFDINTGSSGTTITTSKYRM
jgi:serine/threonine-protein kinase RsbT